MSPMDVDFEFNAIIMGDADHFCHMFDMKYADRIITKMNASPKNVLQLNKMFFMFKKM